MHGLASLVSCLPAEGGVASPPFPLARCLSHNPLQPEPCVEATAAPSSVMQSVSAPQKCGLKAQDGGWSLTTPNLCMGIWQERMPDPELTG